MAIIQHIRSMRALSCPRQCHQLLRSNGILHHVNEKHYLRTGLSIGQRTRFALDHSRLWNYPDLELWRHDDIAISTSKETTKEGDVSLILRVGDKPLHKMKFSVIGDGVPFIGKSQGCSNWHPEARESFEKTFPQNSAMRFCFSAVCGIARAIGTENVIGVRSHQQVCFDPHDHERFTRNYDGFWETLDGQDSGGLGHVIPLPDYDKPIEASSTSHRKRARKRRAFWSQIEEATMASLAYA